MLSALVLFSVPSALISSNYLRNSCVFCTCRVDPEISDHISATYSCFIHFLRIVSQHNFTTASSKLNAFPFSRGHVLERQMRDRWTRVPGESVTGGDLSGLILGKFRSSHWSYHLPAVESLQRYCKCYVSASRPEDSAFPSLGGSVSRMFLAPKVRRLGGCHGRW